MPTTKQGYKNRRNRKNCKYYCVESDFCSKLFVRCVGPVLCNKYTPIIKETQEILCIGREIMFSGKGKGVIASISGDICTVTFENDKIQCKKEQLINRISKT